MGSVLRTDGAVHSKSRGLAPRRHRSASWMCEQEGDRGNFV